MSPGAGHQQSGGVSARPINRKHGRLTCVRPFRRLGRQGRPSLQHLGESPPFTAKVGLNVAQFPRMST